VTRKQAIGHVRDRAAFCAWGRGIHIYSPGPRPFDRDFPSSDCRSSHRPHFAQGRSIGPNVFGAYRAENFPTSPHPVEPAPINVPDGANSLRNLDQFEKLVALLFEQEGFVVHRSGGARADDGIDLTATKDGVIFGVQCKHWKSWRVGVEQVRAFSTRPMRTWCSLAKQTYGPTLWGPVPAGLFAFRTVSAFTSTRT
jgi:hypothetical protein